MLRIRLILTILLLCIIPILGVLRLGHTGVGDNVSVGSCSSLSLSGAASSSSGSSESGEASFTAGEPIDIPVVIAKGVEPIDATQFDVSLGGGLNLVKFKQANAPVTISGKTQQALVTVVAYVDGNIIAEMNVGDDRVFTFNTTSAIFGKAIALVVRGEAGEVSYPVILTLTAPNDNFDFLQIKTHITNVTGIVNQLPAVAQDNVAYTALDINANPLIAYSAIDGGYPLLLTEDPATLVTELDYLSDGLSLVAVDGSGAVISAVQSTNIATTLAELTWTPFEISLSPDDTYLLALDGTPAAATFNLFEVANPSNTTDLIFTNLDMGTDAIEKSSIGWVSDDIGFLALENNASQSYFYIFDLADIVGTSFAATTNASALLAFQTPYSLNNILINQVNSSQFVTECQDANSFASICLSDFESITQLIPSTSGLSGMTNPAFTADGAFIVFEATLAGEQIIAAYSTQTEETILLGEGYKPVASPVNNNIVLYLSEDSLGYTQVSVINLALHPQTRSFF